MPDKFIEISTYSDSRMIDNFNSDPKDFTFYGKEIFSQTSIWHSDLINDTDIEGKLFEEMRIYQSIETPRIFNRKRLRGFVAEEMLTNYQVFVLPPELIKQMIQQERSPIPFFCYAKEFKRIEDAVEWLKLGTLFQQNGFRKALESSEQQLIREYG